MNKGETAHIGKISAREISNALDLNTFNGLDYGPDIAYILPEF